MLTAHGRPGKSTGNTFSDLKYATDLGIAAMNMPLATKWVMTDIDGVTRSPLAWLGHLRDKHPQNPILP